MASPDRTSLPPPYPVMPTYERGDLWSAVESTDLFCITTNSIVLRDGRLVMGAGVARQARERLPGIDLRLGAKIRSLGAAGGVYALLVLDPPPGRTLQRQPLIGAFQTKIHFREPSPLALVERSVQALLAWTRGHPDGRVDLPFPGIGLGGCDPIDVRPILDLLPTTVHVWSFPSQGVP